MSKPEKRRVLFVDRRYAPENHDLRAMINNLGQDYCVEFVFDFLSSRVDDALARTQDVMVTHIPFSEEAQGYYGPALEKLRQIKRKYPELKIIAYTGSSLPEFILTGAGVDATIGKSATYCEDLPVIRARLEKVLQEPA